MLRTPTHFVEIGTNTTKSSTPLIQKLQHHHQQHITPGTTKYHYHEQYSKIVEHSHSHQQVYKSTTTTAEFHLQTKKQQLQTSKNINKLKKKNKNNKSSSSSSTSTSTSISSASSLGSSDDSSSSTTNTTNATTSPPPSLTFREHLLSRGLLSGSPFSFMRSKKAKTVNNATVTVATATKAAPPELRKTSKRFVDFVDCSGNNNSHSGNENSYHKVSKTGASIAAAEKATPTTPPTSITPATTKSTTTTGYFANILSSSSSNTSSSNNSSSSHSNNTKNIYNNNNHNNNNYLTSYTTKEEETSASETEIDGKSTTATTNCSSTTSDQSGSVANQHHTVSTILPFVSFTNTVVAPPTLVAVAVASPPIANNTSTATTTASTTTMSPTTQTPPAARTSLFDSCHRKIRLIGGGPVAFLGGLVAKARRKERDGDQNSTDTKLYLEESVLERKLPEADLKALVDLPAGLDYNEWLASHTLALFEHVNLVYGTISEFCTTSGCPDMTGPGNRTYLWFDEKGKKTRVAAPQYIDYVMTFTQKTVSDESIFPTKYANEFPSSFESIARKILRLQFHVIAHLYAAHFREIALLGLHTHLNLTFAHLTALHRRFNLIDEKETDVLRDLEVALRLTDDTTSSGGGGSQSESGDSMMSSSAAATAGDSGKQGGEDVNSVQHNNTTTPPSLIDGCGGGGGGGGPICTQPEAGTKSQQFGVGGGGGLIGGILGDLSSGEFGDTMHYCTSAVPASSTNCSATNPLQNTTPSTCNSMNGTCSAADQQHATAVGGGCGGGGVTANGNNGAGAFHQHNNNNHVTQHHHHHHPHHHHAAHHHHHHPNHYAQNTGLIQCNASNAPTATAATTSTTTA